MYFACLALGIEIIEYENEEKSQPVALKNEQRKVLQEGEQ